MNMIFVFSFFLLCIVALQNKMEVILTLEQQKSLPHFTLISTDDNNLDIRVNESFPVKTFTMNLSKYFLKKEMDNH